MANEENTHSQDHDLLITLNANVGTLMKQQADFMEKIDRRTVSLETRMNAVEGRDSRDSERFQAISEQMQRTLKNGERIEAAFTKLDELRNEVTTLKTEKSGLQNDVAELKKKSNMFDWLNFIFAGLTSAIAYFLGVNKP